MPDSWRLKLDRAEQHLNELRTEVARYTQSHPYRAVRVVPGPKCHEHPDGVCFRYRLEIVQPDPNLAVIAGDVLHNVRSSLDHLAASMVPSARRGKASFPIRGADPWERQGRRYVVRDAEQRRSFNTAVTGMDPEAVAVIKAVQPYRGGPRATTGSLYLLSRFENADKHRQLVVLAGRLRDVIARINADGWRAEQVPATPPGVEIGVAEDRALIAHFWHPGAPRASDADVQVDVSGAPVVAVKAIEPDEIDGVTGYVEVVPWLERLITSIRQHLLPRLEPYVRRRA